jgi:restriction system protein
MSTLAIIFLVGIAILYLGGKSLTIAYEIILALINGTSIIVKETPKTTLRILGRRSKGAIVKIDNLLLQDGGKSQKQKDIDALEAYDPIKDVGIYSISEIKYPSRLIDIEKRIFDDKQSKNISELPSLLIPNTQTVKQKISSLISCHEFPIPKPTLVTISPPPTPTDYAKLNIEIPSITLPLWEGRLSILNAYVFKEYEQEIKNVEKAKLELEKLLESDAQEEAHLENAYKSAKILYEKALVINQKNYDQSLLQWNKYREEWQSVEEKENNTFQDLLKLFETSDIEKQASLILDNLDLPNWIPCNYEVKFDHLTKILIIEHEFVDIGSINWVKSVSLKNGIVSKPLNQKELKHASDSLYPSIALRLAYELATQITSEVEAIAINGWSDYVIKSSGNIKRAYCCSLLSTADDLKSLKLSSLEPMTAFASLHGIVARSLELTPIAPKIKLNANDSRYVENKDVLNGLSSEQNLASMDWQDFEHLCRELFERLFSSNGSVVKVTQASRDMGVDAVVHNTDPILSGKIVIQAKRYVNTVDVSAVRDLWGTVNHEGAMKGILVTTSQYGPDSYAFIQNKPIQLINGSELLGLLEQYGYKFRIDLEEARRLLKENASLSANKKDSI